VESGEARESLQHFGAAMAGGLLLLRDRLRQVERVVMGVDNPAIILCRANEADASEDGPAVLRSWSAEEVVERSEAEWRGAKNRVAWEKREQGLLSFVLHLNPDRKGK